MTQNNPTPQTKKPQGQTLNTDEPSIGEYRDVFSAKTEAEGQDGGVVTSLLLKGLREGLFDAAIVVRRVEGYCAEAFVAESEKDVLAASGTKYLKVNVTAKLRELLKNGKKRIAIVGTPCEAAAARRIQKTAGKDCEVTILGLFCFEAFNHDKLKAQTQTLLNADLDSVEKIQVRDGKFVAKTAGGEVNCKVKNLDCACEASCRVCGDFTAELADVSVGSVGSAEGYSTVIVRSMAGQQLVKNLKCQKTSANTTEVKRLAMYKRKRAQKNLAELREP